MEKLYISNYSLLDPLAFAFLSFGCFLPVRCLYGHFTAAQRERHLLSRLLFDEECCLRCRFQNVLLLFSLMLLVWGLWFVVYYPGMIFTDTISSLYQVLGIMALNNHHPVAYTLLIKLCLAVSAALGKRNDVGLALYILLQITALSLSVSLLLCRLSERFHLRRIWTLLLALSFACDPFFASFSIAMWKDPFFTVALILLTIQLEGFISPKETAPGPIWLLTFGLVLLGVVFFRNNGIGIVILMLPVFFAVWFFRRGTECASRYGRAALVLLIVTVFYFGITGPVYDRCGIDSPKTEGYGMFLNQMSRVAAYGGRLSEEDQSYMDSLLPLDRFPLAYHPNSIDYMKWDSFFDDQPLNDHFFTHYLSILRKNPRMCFEGWELNSYGFWAVSSTSVRHSQNNILAGGLQNATNQAALAELNIIPGRLCTDPLLDRLFPVLWTSLPAAWIFWLLLLLMFCICAARRWRLLLPLLPGLFLELSILAFTPVAYWARYVILIYYLLPLYLLWFERLRPAAGAAAGSALSR